MADKLPYLALWPKDYLAATFGLNAEQHGGYLLLLMHAWLRPSCSIPNDDDWLASHAGMTATQWRKNKEAILQFWKLDKRRNEWTQKRLREERKKANQKSRSAKDSASSRWKQTKKGDAFAKRSQCYPEPYPEEKPNGFSGAQAREKKSGGFVKPRTAADAAWAAIERRRKKNDGQRDGEGGAITGDDVPLLSSVGGRKR